MVLFKCWLDGRLKELKTEVVVSYGSGRLLELFITEFYNYSQFKRHRIISVTDMRFHKVAYYRTGSYAPGYLPLEEKLTSFIQLSQV